MSGCRRRCVLAGAGLVVLSAGCTTYGSAPEPAPSGAALASTADIPVGGGLIVRDVVITQPVAGTFKAFSSTCTHQGCTVSSVQNGTINCSCHGSRFSVADGSVASGPATLPLAERRLTVAGTSILALAAVTENEGPPTTSEAPRSR